MNLYTYSGVSLSNGIASMVAGGQGGKSASGSEATSLSF